MITTGKVILFLIALYFVIKWAVKNGMAEAYTEITGEKTKAEEEIEEMMEADKKKREDALASLKSKD